MFLWDWCWRWELRWWLSVEALGLALGKNDSSVDR
jgi:hypothetical protein